MSGHTPRTASAFVAGGDVMIDAGSRVAIAAAAEPTYGDDVVGVTFPLTPWQTRLWLERKIHPGLPLHNVLLTVTLTGILEVDRLERAYQAATEQLEFLRLAVDPREPCQWLTTATPSLLEVVDLSADPDALESWLAERSKQIFVSPGPLHRAYLVRLSRTHHVFCVVFDGICTDETSALQLVGYLDDLYDGRKPLPPISFREYSCRLAHQGRSADGRDDELRRSTDMQPQARFYGQLQTGATPEVRRIRHDFGPDRQDALARLAGSSDFHSGDAATARSLLIAVALVALAGRSGDQTDLTVAVPRTASLHLLGPVGEPALLSIQLTADETFGSLFDQLRRQLTDVSVPGREPDSAPPATIFLNRIAPSPSTFSTLRCQVDIVPIWALPQITYDGPAGQFTNVLGIQLTDASTLTVAFDVPADLMSEAQHHRMIDHFGRLLDAMLDDPARRPADVDLLSDAERGRVLDSACGPAPSVAPDLLVQIAEQCMRRPDKTAIMDAERRLTYRELATDVASLAGRLGELGVGPGSLVAVSTERGIQEVTTMLAVLAAGGAYIPLDPTQPPGRIALIMEDARPALLIAERGSALAATSGVPTVYFDDERLQGGGQPVDLLGDNAADLNALAYVLFTSGSTGRPKGVEISRGAMSNFLASMLTTPGLAESDVLLAVTTTAFDIAVLELFGPLCVGATLRIVDSETASDGRRLRKVLEREPVSVMQTTPTRWRMLLEAGWRGDGGLRMLIGGEALTPELARQLLPHGQLWNMYGPTETTVWSTCKRIDRADDITIGRPIDHTQVYVLDRQNRLAPIGVAGELCIGGAGVANGYLGRPDLTAERFVQDPHGRPGEHIYRTGDVGRILDSGEFECLGRLDHQIKIRGFRVELGEIESTLDECPTVSKSVVKLYLPAEGEPRLVAYVVVAPGADFAPQELKNRLGSQLPHYMVPSQYISVSAFPQTSSGKIDRGALPDPADAPDLLGERIPTAARTATERSLLAIWSRVLGKAGIGINDDFFDLGGQSLLAVRIFDEIHRNLGVDLALAVLFETPTIASLGTHIDGLRSSPSTPEWTTVVPVQPSGWRRPIFCVSGVGGNPMSFVGLAAALGDQQPFYGLQHRGADGKLPPHNSIRAMAEEFVHDIRRVQPTGPYVLGGYSAGGLAAYEMARLLTDSGERVDLLVLFDTVNPGLRNWSQAERAGAHWSNLREVGPRYLADRARDRLSAIVDDYTLRGRAKLAAHHRYRYRYRIEALTVAGMHAQSAYRAMPYDGDVLLVRCDAPTDAAHGIVGKSDESNGWREYIGGRLDIAAVPSRHLDMLAGDAAKLVAEPVRHAVEMLSQAQLAGQG
ncbi:MAG: amino acid adenylation domain-containing protein [Mycobacterium sp.]